MESNATFGARLRAKRKAAGLSQSDVEYELRSLLPRALWIDQSKISRFESDKVSEDEVDPYAIEWLCAVYGVEVSEVSPLIADRLRKVRNGLGPPALHKAAPRGA